jgi:hypothetical protein
MAASRHVVCVLALAFAAAAIGSTADRPAQAGTAPAASTIRPGAVLRGTVPWRVVVRQPARVRRVAFFIDGRRRAVDRAAPFRFRAGLDTRRLRNGRHTLRVRIVRRGMATATLTARVRVANRTPLRSRAGQNGPQRIAEPVPPRDPGPRARLFGLHQDLMWDGHAWRRAEHLAVARSVKAEVSRTALLWHMVEPVRGQRDWARSDAVVDELEAASIAPLVVLMGSPAWANGTSPLTDGFYYQVPQDPAAFTAWVGDYAAFAEAAARRYRGRVRFWELWNEPNQHFQWRPRPDIDRYLEWYRAVAAAVHRGDPAAQVAVGGVTGLSAGPAGDVTGIRFLQGLCARGLRPANVAIHPYAAQQQAPERTIQWENNFTDIAEVHDAVGSCGSPDLWVTEWGWRADAVGPAVQADYLRRSLEILWRDHPDVELATYFVDRDRDSYTQGLAMADGTQRPAAAAFRNFVSALPPRSP